MRTVAIGVACLALLAAVLLVAYTRFGGRSLPGIDRSDYAAGATPRHIEGLKSASAEARKKAATALWQIGGPAAEATPALLADAKDPDPAVRAAVFRALGRTSQNTQAAVPALI